MRNVLLLAAACSVIAAQAAVWEFDLGPIDVNGFGLNGLNERPLPVTPSTATGDEAPLGGSGIAYNDDPDFKTLELHFGWGDVSGVRGNNLLGDRTGIHIHGPAGVNGSADVLYDLIAIDTLDGSQQGLTQGDPNTPSAPPTRSGFFDFILELQEDVGGYTIAEQEEQLKSGQWYINIHSTAYPDGEIRGQLIPIPEPHEYAAVAALGLLGFAGYRRFRLARA